jgi:SAM-dependent methyltransferase
MKRNPRVQAAEDFTRRSRSTPADDSAHLREWMEQGMKGLARDSAVLAVGCEQAFLAPQLAQYSADVTVLDTCGGQIAQLARRFPEISFVQHQLAHRLPFGHESFDAVWCCEFLDRVFDPAAALLELGRVLTPGGQLLLTVPNHGTVHSLFGVFFGDEEPAATAHPRLRHFTRTSLAVLAQDAGWAEIEVCTGGATRGPAGQLFRRSLLLSAKKGPGVGLNPVGRTEDDVVEGLWDELAFAGRTLAA